MGTFSFGTEVVTIPSTPNIVLERLRIDRGEREQYRLHRSVSYYDDETARTYVVPPGEEFGDFETDLASVPQLFTWLVPKSGNHLAAASISILAATAIRSVSTATSPTASSATPWAISTSASSAAG
jgi:hypothetical protein